MKGSDGHVPWAFSKPSIPFMYVYCFCHYQYFEYEELDFNDWTSNSRMYSQNRRSYLLFEPTFPKEFVVLVQTSCGIDFPLPKN